jgi:hypothetical protein
LGGSGVNAYLRWGFVGFLVLMCIWAAVLDATSDFLSRITEQFSPHELLFLLLASFAPLAIFVCAVGFGPWLSLRPLQWNVLAIIVSGVAFGAAVWDSQNLTPSILVGAATLATVGWFVQYMNSRELQRRQHTLSVLLQFRGSIVFYRHEHNIFQRYPPGTDIPEGDIDALLKEMRETKSYRRNDSKIDPEMPMPVMLSIRHVLNFYEFLAAAIRARDLDKPLIRNTLEGIMTAFFRKAKPVIKCEFEADPENYEHFRWLVTHWRDNADDRAWNPKEWSHG